MFNWDFPNLARQAHHVILYIFIKMTLLPSGAKGVCSVLPASREGLRAAWAAWVAARSLGRVSASPWSLSECSFSWLMVMEEKGHDKHLYVCCSPGNQEPYQSATRIQRCIRVRICGRRGFFTWKDSDDKHIQTKLFPSEPIRNMTSCAHLVLPSD